MACVMNSGFSADNIHVAYTICLTGVPNIEMYQKTQSIKNKVVYHFRVVAYFHHVL